MPSGRINSWKEIAKYIGKDERTARRWANDRGLPVRRVAGGKRGSIFAFEDELHEWLGRQNGIPTAQPSEEHRPNYWRVGKTALGVLAIAAISVVLVNLYVRQSRVPTKITTTDNAIAAWDAEGHFLWQFDFKQSLWIPPAYEQKWRTQIVDLDGDGRPEVLFAARSAPHASELDHGQEELYCFSSRGDLLWRYKPDIKVQFNGAQDLNGPWRLGGLLPVASGNTRSVWLVVNHALLWSAFIVKFTSSGSHSLQFVDSGIIYALQNVTTSLGDFVLAGGVNNEYRAASIAVLQTGGVPATSPQSDGAKEKCLRGCPSGVPYRYMLFPRSEINRASVSPYNGVDGIDIKKHGATIVVGELQQPYLLQSFYDLSERMAPETVSYSASYNNIHSQFERDGLLKHSLSECRERDHPLPVRVWEPESGWHTINANWAR